MVNVATKSKGDVMAIKRKITEAGRIQDRIAGDLERLDTLKKEIKSFEVSMAPGPESDVVLVSGEYVATLTAEAARHTITTSVNRTLFGMLGVDRFLELATFRVPDMEKEVGEHQFLAICPKEYNGTGRRFSIKPKS